jgi:hypothetical protein
METFPVAIAERDDRRRARARACGSLFLCQPRAESKCARVAPRSQTLLPMASKFIVKTSLSE